jgi:hypothetical protein
MISCVGLFSLCGVMCSKFPKIKLQRLNERLNRLKIKAKLKQIKTAKFGQNLLKTFINNNLNNN